MPKDNLFEQYLFLYLFVIIESNDFFYNFFKFLFYLKVRTASKKSRTIGGTDASPPNRRSHPIRDPRRLRVNQRESSRSATRCSIASSARSRDRIPQTAIAARLVMRAAAQDAESLRAQTTRRHGMTPRRPRTVRRKATVRRKTTLRPAKTVRASVPGPPKERRPNAALRNVARPLHVPWIKTRLGLDRLQATGRSRAQPPHLGRKAEDRPTTRARAAGLAPASESRKRAVRLSGLKIPGA